MKPIKLRELLKLVGELSRLCPNDVLAVVNIDRRIDACFEVEFVKDYEGAGPEYQYLYADDCLESPYFYEIPEVGENPPEVLRGINIDWDSENWMLSKESEETVISNLKRVQAAFDTVVNRSVS